MMKIYERYIHLYFRASIFIKEIHYRYQFSGQDVRLSDLLSHGCQFTDKESDVYTCTHKYNSHTYTYVDGVRTHIGTAEKT